jgi:membrane-bound lytic murein transglycosylase
MTQRKKMPEDFMLAGQAEKTAEPEPQPVVEEKVVIEAEPEPVVEIKLKPKPIYERPTVSLPTAEKSRHPRNTPRFR